MFRRIDRLVLRVPNLASAVSYYRDVLGLKVAREERKVAILKFAEDHGELVLHSDADLPSEAVYLLVDDVRAIYRQRNELKLKFASPPARVARGYRATVRDPFGTLLQLLDRSDESPHAGSNRFEDAKSPGALFEGVTPRAPMKRDLLIRLYTELNRTADDLPYTPHFETLFEPYIAEFDEPKPDRAEVWRHILNLRKAGKLPKLGEARSRPPSVSPEDREQLRVLLGDDIGKRDRLPYTARYEQIVAEFNRVLQKKLSPHMAWRLIAAVAK